jgi:hypothetical protein
MSLDTACKSAQCHLVFSCANILKHLCSIVTSSMLRQSYANPKGQRSHECERGTQECVRHNDFNILRRLTENYMTVRKSACATVAA